MSAELLAPDETNDEDILADLVAVDFDRGEADTGEKTVLSGGPFS